MYGTPVLASDMGGTPELIRQGSTGELFPGGDAGKLKERIRELWEAPQRCERYAENCCDIAFDTVSEYAAKVVDIYGEARKEG